MNEHDRFLEKPGSVARRIAADVTGPAAIPRRNGEPVFNEPWESRIFGAAVALCESGVFEWDEFRERLIAEISVADAADIKGHRPGYYESFLTALERLLIEKSVCARDEIDSRSVAEPVDEDHHN